MGIATGNGHARLGESAFWTHHMHNSLLSFLRGKEIDTKLPGVLLNMMKHLFSQRIGKGTLPFLCIGRNNVIYRSKGAFRKRHRKLLFTNHRESLWGRHFVD